MIYSEKWFFHTLALALGKTVAELKATITYPEFQDWVEYYKDFPFDDFHRYYRPAALNALGKTKMGMQETLDWLQKPQVPDGMNEADLNVLKAFGVM